MKIEDNFLEIFIVNKNPKGTNALMNFMNSETLFLITTLLMVLQRLMKHPRGCSEVPIFP